MSSRTILAMRTSTHSIADERFSESSMRQTNGSLTRESEFAWLFSGRPVAFTPQHQANPAYRHYRYQREAQADTFRQKQAAQ